MRAALLPLLLIILIAGPAAADGFVTFEALPDGSPVTDGLLITDQYEGEPHYLRFEMIGAPDGVAPMVAAVGPPGTAFNLDHELTSACSPAGPTYEDMPLAAADVGCFFLTDPPAPGGDWTLWTWDLRVTYMIPVNYAGGDIIDLDHSAHHSESFIIRARGTGGQILDQLYVYGWEDGGEGDVTHWEFHSADLIASVEFVFSDPELIAGVAFDNFSPGGLTTAVEGSSFSTIKRYYR